MDATNPFGSTYPCFIAENFDDLPVIGGILPVGKELRKFNEREVQRIGLMLISLIGEAFKSLEESRPKDFDGNPGDFGCQRQALHVFRLMGEPELIEECRLLNQRALKLKPQLLKATQGKRPLDPTAVLSLIESLPQPSEKLGYMLICRMLYFVKVGGQPDSDGVVVTKCDFSKLTHLVKHIGKRKYSDYLRQIVEVNRTRVSILSMKLLREEAESVDTLPDDRLQFVAKRLSIEESPLFTLNPKYLPIMFGCLFYDFTIVIERLRRQRAILCVKSVEVENGPVPSGCLFSVNEESNEFESLKADISVNPKKPIVVFEGVVSCPKDELARRVDAIGFTELMLRAAANAPQYFHTSTLSDVRNPVARAEIEDYRSREVDFIKIDHVYTSNLETENCRRVGR